MSKVFKNLFLYLIVATTSLAFVSCGDDDDEPVVGNASIVGAWESTDWTYNGKDVVLRLEFASNNTGSLSVIFSDGTDTSTDRFEYVLRDADGKSYLSIIWTGIPNLGDGIYQEGVSYEVTVAPTHLIWGGHDFIRR